MGRQRFGIIISLLLSTLLFFGCGGEGGTGGTDGTDTTTGGFTGDAESTGSTFTGSALLSESINGDQWLNSVLFQGQNRLDPRLPQYSYFQGLIQSGTDLNLVGQVRLVGGVLGADGKTSLYQGAMVTTNPYAFTGAEGLIGGPAGLRTRVSHWEEIPTSQAE